MHRYSININTTNLYITTCNFGQVRTKYRNTKHNIILGSQGIRFKTLFSWTIKYLWTQLIIYLCSHTTITLQTAYNLTSLLKIK